MCWWRHASYRFHWTTKIFILVTLACHNFGNIWPSSKILSPKFTKKSHVLPRVFLSLHDASILKSFSYMQVDAKDDLKTATCGRRFSWKRMLYLFPIYPYTCGRGVSFTLYIVCKFWTFSLYSSSHTNGSTQQPHPHICKHTVSW